MRTSILVALVALIGPLCPAEVVVKSCRNQGQRENPAFTFPELAPPTATDAGVRARLFVISGQVNPASGGLAALTDGELPLGDDDPDRNFFFQGGTEGGRVGIDLGKTTAVFQVSSYSWHRDVRGPQVYRLYGGNPETAGFTLELGAHRDPTEAGWTLLASVDTRPPKGQPGGGQYGVHIWRRGAPQKLGDFRYLLLDIRRTGLHERFDQTFFSEIDVNDGRQHELPEPTIAFDTSETPALTEWVEKTLQPICRTWYPKIVQMLPSQNYRGPRHVTVTFNKDMKGVAHTAGTKITCAEPWFRANLRGEAAGAVVHELVHVAQQYRHERHFKPNPPWLVEGVADYIRWFLYEPERHRPRVNPARDRYTDGYRTAAALLDYAIRTYDKDLLAKLNAEMRHGLYGPHLWKQWTRKTLDELWAEYVGTLK